MEQPYHADVQHVRPVWRQSAAPGRTMARQPGLGLGASPRGFRAAAIGSQP